MEIEKLIEQLQKCTNRECERCRLCHEDDCDGYKVPQMAVDALESLQARLEQVTRERDAAAKDLSTVSGKCNYCKWHKPFEICQKTDNDFKNCWEWRGLQEERHE